MHMANAGLIDQNIDMENIRSSKLYKDLIKILKKVDILQDEEAFMRVSDLDDIIDVIEIEKFKTDQIVFNYGDAGDKFYIILGG